VTEWLTGLPGPDFPDVHDLRAAQAAPCAANTAGCTDAEYDRLILERKQTEAAYLAGYDRALGRELEGGPGGFAFVRYEPTPYDLGISEDPDADWPPPVNGIPPSPEAVAAHFGFVSAAEMRTAVESARDADIDAEVEARLEREALEAEAEAGA
jgi:hypothetical protein